MSRQPTLPARNKKCEQPVEMYEEVTPPAHSARTSRQENRYTESNFQATQCHPSSTEQSAPVPVVSTIKKRKGLIITLATILLLCLLVVSLVAVILYSPLTKPSGTSEASTSASVEDLLSRIEQLERRVEQLREIRGTNYTLDTLTSLQESQESVQTSISQLSSFDSTVTSQFTSVQNLIQSLGSVQSNLREDMDRLRSVNLYHTCTPLTRSCTISSGSGHYWRSCTAGYINIDPDDTQYYAVDMRCEYESSYGYFESTAIYKTSGNNYYCYCDVIYPAGSSGTHLTLSSSFTATCTLIVTRCPLSLNLLNTS